ncbi:MAG TPA: rod shape-determining protein RodA [Clostridiaceae bacterium]|nr:rod shape-determining protein RodA [Clostridiaceae bacterium]
MYFIEKTKDINFIKQFDYILFGAVLSLSIIGLFVLSSATKNMPDGARMMRVQIFSFVIGSLLALIISAIDYKVFKNVSVLLYLGSIFLLILVLFVGKGYETVGSRSWLVIPVFGSFQPAEFAKITFVVFVSVFLERIKDGQGNKKDIVKFVIYSVLPTLLVGLQPDYGTAFVFVFTFFIMIFVFGIKYKYIFITAGLFLLSTPLLWFYVLNEPRKNRIREFLFPGQDELGTSFQSERAKMTIGSGRIFGKGLYQGIQTQSNGVPVKESDMIFTVIGEELGFIGCIIVVILVFIILFRCLHIARSARDYYGSYVVAGLTGMLGFYFIQNIGMCLQLMPVTGLPLPFVSQGGSAMITNFILIGVILSVSMRRKRGMFFTQQ